MKRKELKKILKKNINLYDELTQRPKVAGWELFYIGKADSYAHILWLLKDKTRYDNSVL